MIKDPFIKYIFIVFFLICLYKFSFAYEGAFENTYCPHNDCSRAMRIIDSFQVQFSVGQCQECSKEYPNRVVHCKSNFTDHYYLNGEIISQDKVDLLAEQSYLREQKIQQENNQNVYIGGKKISVRLLFYLILGIVIFCIVSAILGIRKGLKQQIAIFSTRKDLLITPLLFWVSLICLVLGCFIFITWYVAPVLLLAIVVYNIYKAIKNGTNNWERWLIFSARSFLNLISMFIAFNLWAGGRRKGVSDIANAINNVSHAAFWSTIGFLYYKWLMKFVDSEKVIEIEASNG